MPHSLLLLASMLPAQPSPVPPPAEIRQWGGWSMSYYKNPDTAKLKEFATDFVKPEIVNHRFFLSRDDVQRNLAIFLGVAADGQPEVIRHYESLWPQTDDQGRRVLMLVLTYCGDQQTREKIPSWASQAGATLKKELDQLTESLRGEKRQRPSDRPARTPKDLDQCWAEFFATGQFAGPARILDAIDHSDNPAVREAAKWSFESLCQSHPKLAKMAREALPQRQGASRQFLESILNKP